jgi:hypothetical protein
MTLMIPWRIEMKIWKKRRINWIVARVIWIARVPVFFKCNDPIMISWDSIELLLGLVKVRRVQRLESRMIKLVMYSNIFSTFMRVLNGFHPQHHLNSNWVALWMNLISLLISSDLSTRNALFVPPDVRSTSSLNNSSERWRKLFFWNHSLGSVSTFSYWLLSMISI